MDNSQNSTGYFPQVPVCNESFISEVSSDFSLPDYKNEIRRLLFVTPTLIHQREYLDNASSTHEGEISYKVTYVGADGGLYCATLTDRYSIDIPLHFNAYSLDMNDVSLITTCSAGTPVTKVLGPRKLNIRTKITCRALALSPAMYSPVVDGLETQVRQTKCAVARKCVGEPLTVGELISTENGTDDIRIIDLNALANVHDCFFSNGLIKVTGDVLCRVLCCRDGSESLPFAISKKLPFSTEVPCELDSVGECNAQVLISDEFAEVRDGGVFVEMNLVPYVKMLKGTMASYYSDCFSTECHCQTKHERANVLVPIKCSAGNLTHNSVLPLDEVKLPKDAHIIECATHLRLNEVVYEDTRLQIHGECEHHILYSDDAEIGCTTHSTTFRYTPDCRISADVTNLVFDVGAQLFSSRARADDERVFIDCEMKFNLLLMDNVEISPMVGVELGEAREGLGKGMILCYPEADEPLWSVAKRYGVKLGTLKSKNSIPESEEKHKSKYLVI